MNRSTVLIFLITSLVFASTIQYDWNSSSLDVQIDAYGEWDVITIDEGMPAFANGYPNLPAVSRCCLIRDWLLQE